MILSHTHKFIFIKTKKVGGSSVENYFHQFLPDNEMVKSHHTQKDLDDGLFEHARIQDIQKADKYNKHPQNYFVFTIVRHPMERIISEFYWSDRNGYYNGNFDTFLTNSHFRGTFNYSLIIDKNGEISKDINFIIRFENLINELNMVLSILRMSTVSPNDLPKEKSGYRKDKRPWYEFMNSDQVNYIYNNFQKELEIHRQLGYRV